MATTLRRRWMRARTMAPDMLSAQKGGSPILMSSTAGYANQVRAALAIAAAGLVPVVQTNAEYQAAVAQEEGIDLGGLFDGFVVEGRDHLGARVYRDWIIPPWPGVPEADAAQIFNVLNWPGLVNAARLPFLKDELAVLRGLFDSFQPRLPRKETAARVDADTLAVHLRMFGRNYATRYTGIGPKAQPARHYVKEAWSPQRLNCAVAAVATLAAPGAPIAVYTDRRDHPDAQRFVELITARGYHPTFADLHHDGALGAMEESLLLSGHRRMVLTSTSSFGHLAALLAEDLESVLSV